MYDVLLLRQGVSVSVGL